MNEDHLINEYNLLNVSETNNKISNYEKEIKKINDQYNELAEKHDKDVMFYKNVIRNYKDIIKHHEKTIEDNRIIMHKLFAQINVD
jgi:flagellar biosynthesis chaperone FliJ